MNREFAIRIDTQLSALYQANAGAISRLYAAQDREFKARYYGKKEVPQRVADELAAATLALEPMRAAEKELEAERSAAGGWSRYFMVPGGHLHGSHCSTLRPRTARTWIPELSGADEAEVVGTLKTAACTKCFRSAPVDRGLAEAERVAKKAQRELDRQTRILRDRIKRAGIDAREEQRSAKYYASVGRLDLVEDSQRKIAELQAKQVRFEATLAALYGPVAALHG